MRLEEILEALSHDHDQFPREMLEAAIAAKDEITPHLLTILERTAEDPETAVSSQGWAAGYAMYLLAQFRETRAYPLVAKIAALPEPLIGDLLGDTITEGLNQILASVSGGDISLIAGLIENEDADEFARTAALEALLIMVAVGIKPREEVIGYFQSLFRGGLKREPSFVWDYLISAASDLYPEEVYEDIEKAFADELALENVTDLDWIKQRMTEGKDATLSELRQKHHLIDDVIDEMEGWAMYDAPDEEEDDLLGTPLDWSHLLNANPRDDQNVLIEEDKAPQIPYRAPKKVGRNDPCPCGSGKKYKKCCGA